MKQVKVVISGLVQGVSFRFYVSEEAKKLGITGFVRNRKDGTVEALFQGEEDAIGKMIRRCLAGPQKANIEGVSIHGADELPYRDFVIKQ